MAYLKSNKLFTGRELIAHAVAVDEFQGGKYIKSHETDRDKGIESNFKLMLGLLHDPANSQIKLTDGHYDRADDIIEEGNQSSIYSSHMADAGSDQQSLEHAYSIINRESSFLNYLDLALQRIDQKSFGVCSKCEELISKERLHEVPHATKCFDCKTSNR